MQHPERQLHPSSKVLDAFTRPPFFRAVDRRSGEKRRSADSAFLLNAAEDIRPDDPIFILRKATGLRNSGKSKPAPLDDYALQKKHYPGHPHHNNKDTLHGEPISSDVHTEENGHAHPSAKTAVSPTTMSRQELIAAQRFALREKQRAILSAQTNSERGVDILLPGNAMLRSTALDASGNKMRYSYVQDGEIYDISDIVEEERRAGKEKQSSQYSQQQRKDDWLEGVVRQDALGDNLDRLLTRIKDSRAAVVAARAQAQAQQGRILGELKTGSSLSPTTIESRRVSDLSAYSVDDQEEVGPPSDAGIFPPPGQQQHQPSDVGSGSRAETSPGHAVTGRTTPIRSASKNDSLRNKQPSAGSMHSDEGSSSTNELATPLSASSTPPTTVTQHGGSAAPSGRTGSVSGVRTGAAGRRSPLVVKGDLGVANMITVIELNAGVNSTGYANKKFPTTDYVDNLFGPTINLEELHPRIRDLYAGTLKQLDDMDFVSIFLVSATSLGVLICAFFPLQQLDQALSMLYPTFRNG